MGMILLSPRMKSSVILAMNIQVASGHCPRDSFMKASFKMGKVFSDAVCRAYHVGGSLSVSPAMMSGLAMVTDTLVSMVTRHAFSYICSSACRLSWLYFSVKLSM